MVSAISLNNNYYCLNTVTQASKNVNSLSQGEIEKLIRDDWVSIKPDTYTPARTYEEYVSNQKYSLMHETIAKSGLEASKTLTIEEYNNKKQNYYNKVNECDFKTGFNEYMKSLGCNNEEDLANYATEEEKNYVMHYTDQLLTWAAGLNPGMVSALHDLEYIKSNIDFDKYQKFYEDLHNTEYSSDSVNGVFENEIRAVQNLLSSIDGLENKELYVQGLDLYFLQNKCANLSGEIINSDKIIDDFIKKSQIYYDEFGGSREDFISQYITSEIDAKIKELEELTLLKEEQNTEEQSSLSDSFISTKIVASKILQYQK